MSLSEIIFMDHSRKDFSIFLCGDVMTGRGIDQILPHPNNPQLYESYITDARGYVLLAEEVNGKIPYPVSMDYIWGDALTIWQQYQPDAKIINLETAVTQSNDYWPNKSIHYRMHPLNIDVLTVAGIDICTLANNHILDWGYVGLAETLKSLKKSGIKFSGAGINLSQAMQPAIIELALNKRVLVFSAGMASSGVPANWSASADQPGLYYLDLNPAVLAFVCENINQYRQPGDLIIFSLHCGSNWGYEVPSSLQFFAHSLIDYANVDVVCGHSSHHPRPIELYNGKPILYGCGDFINDYEGISGYDEFRGDLTLMYILNFDGATLKFKKMHLIPMQIKKFSLHRASPKDCEWLLKRLNQFSIFKTHFIGKASSIYLG